MLNSEPQNSRRTESSLSLADRAQVRHEEISRVTIRSLDKSERPISSFHPTLVELYTTLGFDKLPRSFEEAKRAGASSWNGKSVCASALDCRDGELSMELGVAPYFISRAMKEAVSLGYIAESESWIASPKLVNVSVVVVSKFEGRYHLVGQVKGEALGSGEIHGALAAGAVELSDLEYRDPLDHALKAELQEEIGISAEELELSVSSTLIDESRLGMVNFMRVGRYPDAHELLLKFIGHKKKILAAGASEEVHALAALKIPESIVVVPLENGSRGVRAASILTEEGIRVEDRAVRPYTDAVARLLSNESKCRKFIERAGF